MLFTDAEGKYLRDHPLGRLATIGPDGAPQAHPVSISVGEDREVIEIGGPEFEKSQKFRNVLKDPRVSLVVDDQSEKPNPIGQTGRGIEIRGTVEIVNREKPLIPGFSSETLVLSPTRIVSWNIGEFPSEAPGMPLHMRGYNSRNIAAS